MENSNFTLSKKGLVDIRYPPFFHPFLMILTNCQAESEIFSWRRDEFDAYSNITPGLATTAYNVFRLPFYYKIMLDLLRSEIVGIYLSFKHIEAIYSTILQIKKGKSLADESVAWNWQSYSIHFNVLNWSPSWNIILWKGPYDNLFISGLTNNIEIFLFSQVSKR